MKSFITCLVMSGALAAAAATPRYDLQARDVEARDMFFTDTANDMESGKCAPAAVIFARGTFDSGNIGVWVGPPMLNPLKAQGLAIQGVDASAYPADLAGYLKEGGSNSGAKSLAATVTSYAKKCPKSAIVISGWSQGALVAHKGLGMITDPHVKSQIAGFVTFGDPAGLFGIPAVSGGLPSTSYCITGTIFDPLCAKLPGDFKLPTSVKDITGPFTSMPSIAHGAQQAKAAASLVAGFPGQLAHNVGTFLKDLATGKIMQLMLTPQHFTYGNEGDAEKAAAWILALPKVKAALAGGSGGSSSVGASETTGSGKSAATSHKTASASSAKAAASKSKLRRDAQLVRLVARAIAIDNVEDIIAREADAEGMLIERDVWDLELDDAFLNRRQQLLEWESGYY